MEPVSSFVLRLNPNKFDELKELRFRTKQASLQKMLHEIITLGEVEYKKKYNVEEAQS